MSYRSFLGSVGFGALLGIAASCVPAAVGYHDVRGLTSARIGKQVRWHEHDSAQKSDADTERLLARPLTPDTAVQVALLNNESLQAAFEQLGIARGQLLHAFRLPNPSVGAALRYGAGERPEIDLDATLSLSQLLFLPWRSGVGEAELDTAKLEVVERVLDLAFETRVAFLAYQALSQQLELQRTVLQALQASHEMAENLHRAGNITDLNLASERALYEEARIATTRAEAMRVVEREKLNAHMGLWGTSASEWSAEAKLQDPVPAHALLRDFERRALERSLDLELSRRRFRAAALRANLSRLEGWVPDLRAGVSAERQDGDWSLGPMAELEVPLFYQGQGETAVALAEMRREQKLSADTAVRLRARARAVASQLTAAVESATYYQTTVLPLREEVVQQTQLEYNGMNAGVFQLLQAKRDQIAAGQAYVSLLHDYWRLRTEAAQLLAGRLPQTPSEQAAPLKGAPPRASGSH